MSDPYQEKINRYNSFLMDSTNFKSFDNLSRLKKQLSDKTLEENIKLHNLITKLNELSLFIRNNNLNNQQIYNVLSYILFKFNSSFDKVESNIVSN